MQPTTTRDFLKVTLQRLADAEQIMDVLLLTLEAHLLRTARTIYEWVEEQIS